MQHSYGTQACSGLHVVTFHTYYPNCREDLDYFITTKVDGHCDPEVKNRLQHVAQSGFKRISYTEAIDILLKAIQEFKPQKKGDKLFEFPVGFNSVCTGCLQLMQHHGLGHQHHTEPCS